MSYDKDWEVYLALNDPDDPIHDHIEQQLNKNEEDTEEKDDGGQ